MPVAEPIVFFVLRDRISLIGAGELGSKSKGGLTFSVQAKEEEKEREEPINLMSHDTITFEGGG